MRFALAIAMTLPLAAPALALDPAEQRGQTFALTNCSICHAVLGFGDSPLPLAPPFRTLHTIRDIDGLAEPLHIGTVSENPNMPHFLLDADQINDLIAYLHTFDDAPATAQ